MGKLVGQRILITGGGSGIGLATAKLCLAEGARVAITGRNEARLRAAAGDTFPHHAADLTDAAQAQRMVDDLAAKLGGLDVLVNNAGMNIRERAFSQLTPESWRELVAGNLDGAFYCMLAALPRMREQKAGLVINVNSISGKRASPLGGSGYIAAKFGLRGLAMGVAAEERSNGLRVCSIYPGEVNTPILDARPEPVSDERRRTMLQPEDVAAAVVFVASLPAHVAIPELIITPANAQYL